jgi:hypothetical protein
MGEKLDLSGLTGIPIWVGLSHVYIRTSSHTIINNGSSLSYCHLIIGTQITHPPCPISQSSLIARGHPPRTSFLSIQYIICPHYFAFALFICNTFWLARLLTRRAKAGLSACQPYPDVLTRLQYRLTAEGEQGFQENKEWSQDKCYGSARPPASLRLSLAETYLDPGYLAEQELYPQTHHVR